MEVTFSPSCRQWGTAGRVVDVHRLLHLKKKSCTKRVQRVMLRFVVGGQVWALEFGVGIRVGIRDQG